MRALGRVLAGFLLRVWRRQWHHSVTKGRRGRTPIALQTALPTARFVVLVRDPRDFICSLRAFMKRESAQKIDPYIQMDATRQAQDWLQVYDGYINYLERHLVVRYEDLVRDGESVTRRILEFLGLDPDVDLSSAEDGVVFQTHGTSSTATSSIGRWREDLSEADLGVIESVCGELMQRLGYELSSA